MLRALELTVAIAALVVGIVQLSHEVTGGGPSPVGVVREIVLPQPDTRISETDIPQNLDEFHEEFDRMVEERFPDHDEFPERPEPPGFFDNEFPERP